MLTTKLSTKGQITIPKSIRYSQGWQEGLQFILIETEHGLLLKPMPLFEETTVADVLGSANYQGEPKTLEEMEEAIIIGASQQK